MRPPEQAQPRRDWSRRDFGRAVAGAASAAVLGTEPGLAQVDGAEESRLGRFCRSLNAEQRQALVLPFADPKRTMVQNHWAIVPATIASLTADQQELALDLIRQVCTTEGFARLTRQRLDDASGWKHDHLVVFGSPADPRRFEWVVTGRHLTLRGSADGTIRGGPIFLGDTTSGLGNLWQEAADLANLFQSRLGGASLLQVIDGSGRPLAGLRPGQQAVMRQLFSQLTSLFRAMEVPAISACLDSADGFDSFTWEAFPAEAKPCTSPLDAWRLTGPGLRWSFHARPHAHCWLDLA